MRRHYWLMLAPLALLLLACAAGPAPRGRAPLLVAAAADVTLALQEIAARYEAETGQSVTLTSGSTGQLAQQIEHGAPVDVFFAADEPTIDLLATKGLIAPGTRRTYGVGRLALVASASSAARVRTLDDLAHPAVRAVAIANPEHAPYGRAAREALQRSGLWAAVQPKLVLGENVTQTFQHVHTGNADAGLVALALVAQRPGVAHALVDDALHAPLRQAAGVVARSQQADAARGFLDYAGGPVGRAILARYGFSLPGELR